MPYGQFVYYFLVKWLLFLFVTMAPRKHVTLTLDQKIEIIKQIENCHNYCVIAEKNGIGKSTVGDIKKKYKENYEVCQHN